MTITKDIELDYGAPTGGVLGGVTANSAFVSARTAARAAGTEQFVLTSLTPHEYFLSGAEPDPGYGTQLILPLGVKKIIYDMPGSTITNNHGSSAFTLGVNNVIYLGTTNHARIATVNAGATSVTLVTPSDASYFSVNTYAKLTGIDVQGYGQPPNPALFDWIYITDITGAVITFNRPLTNSYKSTWPHYADGTAFEPDLGGPGTLYAIHPEWDVEVEYRGAAGNNLTIDADAAQISGAGRRVTYRHCTFTQNFGLNSEGGGAFPSDCKLWRLIDCTFNTNMEFDKCVENVLFERGTFNQPGVQSSAVKSFRASGATITNQSGTPDRFTGINCTIGNLWLGPLSFGRGKQTTLVNTTPTTFQTTGLVDKGNADAGLVAAGWTMSAGVITVPAGYVVRGAIPGAYCFFGTDGNTTNIGGFKILDIGYDGSNNLLIYTDWARAGGGFPNPGTGVKLWLINHPAPIFSQYSSHGVPVTGTIPGRPFASYSTYSFASGVVGTAGAYGIGVYGIPTSISYNVTVAAGAPMTFKLSEFGNLRYYRSDYVGTPVYNPQIDMTQAGERLVIPGTTTTLLGTDSGLDIPADAWIGDGIHSVFSNNTAGATIVVTVYTDQGVPVWRVINS